MSVENLRLIETQRLDSDIVGFFSISLLSHLLLCASVLDRITPGQFISSHDTLVSDGGAFMMGFFSPSNSSSDIYVGIWYNIPQRTVVWVANREKSISDSSAAVLSIAEDSNLIINASRGITIWSSSLSGLGTTSNGTELVLLNSGNLVLRKSKNNILWQSFDHPTDTFLIGMSIGFNYVNTHPPVIFFTSWKNGNDPSPGKFSFGIDSNAYLQLLTWRGSMIYWRSQVWDGNLMGRASSRNFTSMIYLTLTRRNDGFSLELSVSDPSSFARCTLHHSGAMQCSSWDRISQNWQIYSSVPTNDCNLYGWCGQFAYCDPYATLAACKCLEGFEPTLQSQWDIGNYSAGCSRRMVLQCGEGDEFQRVEGMKLPDQFVYLRNRNLGDCKSECIRNCSCTAYAYAEVTQDNSTMTRCLVWMGELIDTETFPAGGQDLYLRLMNSTSSTLGSKSKSRKTIIIVSLSSAIFCLVCSFMLWKFRKEIKGICLSVNSRNNLIVFDESSGEEPVQGQKLPLIHFDVLLVATDNFSDSNKLGRGGFGIVYKGKLPSGQEIAVKRLLIGSGQGAMEFKNEMITIIKLQHKNLVKLLGCCVHGEEKLLVYEYMPNKALDFFLFDPAQKIELDWGKRFNIIKGIARGLLYLHEDSRLRIIHRDLKASNILLDKDMTPKISDFGIARIFRGNQNEANTKRIVGTYGYMSPEYAMQGLFSVKSDVYSFGVLLLEILRGCQISSFPENRNYHNLLDYAWKLWTEGNAKEYIDPSIANSCNLDQAIKSIHVGLFIPLDEKNSIRTLIPDLNN
ncbi:hypothetical protein ZIOFF_056087 [Zingiber officinale]|uniref:Receptor-like serine/threonine-protein kinase n=1 Tax=Zingiber officinale TaxID=94328 RepID=A0A8J5FHL5_ZINOF|nr:hypothetical protein ZIOFF_056087 [Zingiber officinale]